MRLTKSKSSDQPVAKSVVQLIVKLLLRVPSSICVTIHKGLHKFYARITQVHGWTAENVIHHVRRLFFLGKGRTKFQVRLWRHITRLFQVPEPHFPR